ncbi:MAG: plastocyanin [Burkholderiales bacterium]|uniref:plastocyanin n=1 Tax=Inhella sp. TaxID=1921806 RepID=UPI001ACA9836|nr:plastocyanin [Burkholderiales bacterium]
MLLSLRLLPLTLLMAAGAQAADVDVQVLDRDGKPLAGAVVVLETSSPGARPAPPAELVISQEKMKFQPEMAVAHLSTKVRFTNLDRWDHHVRGGQVGPGGVYVDASRGYSFRLAGRAPGKAPSSAEQSFTQTGPQMLGCHLHGSMRAYLYVTDSPWAAVSDAEGRVRLAGVPNGAARLRVWHADELIETPQQALNVTDGLPAQRLATQVVPRKPKKASEELKIPGY